MKYYEIFKENQDLVKRKKKLLDKAEELGVQLVDVKLKIIEIDRAGERRVKNAQKHKHPV